MSIYRIERQAPERRAAVEAWLDGLDRVDAATRELIVTAWVTAWSSSSHERLHDMPYSLLAPSYPLMRHVNEVTRTGLALAERAAAEWGERPDLSALVPILVLHDVDKPLLYRKSGDKTEASPLARELPHGVVGAMLLKELGFPDRVVSTVATHASNAPFHGRTLEAYLLHYADFFATDHALMQVGTEPFYQRHWR